MFMALSKSDELTKNISGLVHQDTQQQKFRLDLTLSEVHEFTGAGSLDFGGSEFEPATTQIIKPKKNDPGDDYGWWNLKGGIYRAICNESFKPLENHAIFIVPHEHAQSAGVMVNTIVADRNLNSAAISLLIHVPDAGCKIKENARFASAYMVSGKQGYGNSVT